MRQPDPITLQRVSKLLGAARALLVEEITIVWLARTLVRVDGGPMLDAPRLGPALRMLGFQSTRRRQGIRKVSVWLPPGVSPPPLGRPPRGSHTGSATAILPLAAATRGRRCGEDRESSHFDLLEVTRCCHDVEGHTMTKIVLNNTTAHLFVQVLDRAQTEMPEWYLRSAQGVLIAGPGILSTSGHRPGIFHAAGWCRGESGFRKVSRDGKSVLWVQPCGKFWIIERSIHLDAVYMQDEALISAFGARPIWTRTRQAAMQLAEHCDPMPRDPVAGYWAYVGNVRVLSAQLPYRSAG